MEAADNQINAKTARARILVLAALVCLLDPSLLPNLDSAFKEKITNPQVLGTVDDDSNFVVAKIHLK
jgi:hypothetical protein